MPSDGEAETLLWSGQSERYAPLLSRTIIQRRYGTCSALVSLALLLVVPVGMIITGTIHVKDCPKDEKIPLYMILGGAVCILDLLFYVVEHITQVEGLEEGLVPPSPTRRCARFIRVILTTFLLVWLILGTIWVYRAYQPSYTPGLPDYCSKELYLAAFWLITATWVPVGLLAATAAILALTATCRAD